MTTNHRPQLESKRGRDIAIKNTIQHARSQPGQTKLKIRSDITGAQVSQTAGKRALEELHDTEKKSKLLHTDSSRAQLETEGRASPNLASSESHTASESTSGEADTKESNIEQTTGEPDSNSPSTSDSDSESGDDTEALMAELAKTRNENQANRHPVPAKADAPAKRSWRSKTSFSRKTQNTESQFTTDTMKSRAHQKFLSDFIR